MYIGLHGEKVIIILEDADYDSINNGTSLELQGLYGETFVAALVLNEAQLKEMKTMSQIAGRILLDIHPSKIEWLKKGNLIDYSDVVDYPLYLSGTALIEIMGHSKTEPMHNLNAIPNYKPTLQ